MPILWREAMAIDGGVIDDDHRSLFDIYNRFEQLTMQGGTLDDLETVMKDLKIYAALHFEREEEIQRLVAYPFLEAHRREHEDLKGNLRTVIAELRATSDRTLKAVAPRVTELLTRWIVDHVVRSDLLMIPYIKRQRTGRRTQPLAEYLQTHGWSGRPRDS